ncbi:unnamed protein product, partial [Adineta steineri]
MDVASFDLSELEQMFTPNEQDDHPRAPEPVTTNE